MINNAHPGSSLVLLSLIDRVLLRKNKPVSRAELLGILRPEMLPKLSPKRKKDADDADDADGTAMRRFEWNLDFWIKEGLWLKDDDTMISVSSEATERNLPKRVLELLIANARSQTDQAILDDKNTEPFFRAMTCLLVQQGYTFMGGETVLPGKNGNAQKAVNRWLPGERGLNLSNELPTFLQYGDFLGFLEPFGAGYIVDPTRAIEPHLQTVFGSDNKLSLRIFIERLAEQIPLLDGGRYRRLLEPLMQELGWHPREVHQVSPSLSHALVRLESAFRLRFDKASDDTSSMQLQLPEGKHRFVSEVVYLSEVNA
ncbi:protein DpdG [Pseudomonas sp. NPDC090592]|uniref:protein DpdG n=1 Tax=Pseudomonas sp. NPDC090592 TaxID=3364480 RepID=UPI00383AAAAF